MNEVIEVEIEEIAPAESQAKTRAELQVITWPSWGLLEGKSWAEVCVEYRRKYCKMTKYERIKLSWSCKERRFANNVKLAKMPDGEAILNAASKQMLTYLDDGLI